MTERLPFHFSLSCIGEGNGNPLQCSCLENPRDGGAWWAAVYGVAQSWTWLKWLSSSSGSSNSHVKVNFPYPVILLISYSFFVLFTAKLPKSVSPSAVSDSATPWTVACLVPLSMGFSRQEYWSGLPFPSPGDLPYSVIEPGVPAL